MTSIVVIVFLIIGDVWFALRGPFFVSGVTIYPVLFLITLSTASLFAYRSKNEECITAAIAMFLHMVAHQIVWNATYSYFALSVLYIVFSAYFLSTSLYRWQVAIGGIYLACATAGVLNYFGFIPGHLDRPYQFIAFSYPDVIAILGHCANVVLGASSGDSGVKARSFFTGAEMEPVSRLNHLSRTLFRL